MSRDVQFKQQLEGLAKQAYIDVDAEHDPETSRRASNAGLRREAAVQRKGAGEAAAAGKEPELAAQGVQGSGAQLPHLDRIQSSFGAHDVSGVQAHTGGQAATASKAMGAEAYATGNNVAFAGQPDLHTAAHEAAHVVQQRKGVQLAGNVGQAGDAHERVADEVADRVVAGKPAGDLLGEPKNSAAPAEAVQKKETKKEEAPVTPEDKAAADQKSDTDTRQAISASILLLAKDMHRAVQTFQKERNHEDKERPGANVDVTIQTFQSVFAEATRVKDLLAGSNLTAKEKNFLFDSMTRLDGARFQFEAQFGLVNSFVGPGVLDASEAGFKSDMKAIYASTGDKMNMEQSVRAEPSKKHDVMQADAIKAHLTAANDAVASTAMGNPDVARISLHIKEIHELVPAGVAHAMRPFKAEVKQLRDAVAALEKSHPQHASQLKQVDVILKELTNLSK